MSVVKFTETIFRDQNKKGVLPKPDENGYYTIMVGALNCFNSAGEFYVAKNSIKLFQESSPFMRRIQSGCLFSELGHPRREKGMSYTDYYQRMIDIVDTNVCAHFSEVWLDTDYGRKHPECGQPDMIAIFAKVKPHGPHADTLRSSLETAQINTAFSIRGITDNFERNGRIERELTCVFTFDHVVMPGIKRACKAFAPGLESDSSLILETGQDVFIQKELLRDVVMRKDERSSFATESSRLIMEELRPLVQVTQKPVLAKW